MREAGSVGVRGMGWSVRGRQCRGERDRLECDRLAVQ